MKPLRIALVISFLTSSLSAFAAERVGDFALLDQAGYFHHMSWYDNNDAIVLLVQGNGDAAVTAAMPKFVALEETLSDEGLQFFMINPLGLNDRTAVQAELDRMAVEIPVLMDDTQLISEALGINALGEAIVFDPKSFTVEYRGPVDADLEAALQQLINGETLANAAKPFTGTAVAYASLATHQQAAPSYKNDIAPIIADNCATCHREGGIAPFAMDSYTMVLGWSPMIREVLMTKRMPPGQIDSHIGEFVNDMLLTDAESQKLIHWVNAGSPNDGGNDPLAQLEWPTTEWEFGEPDYVIEIPPQEVPATGVLDYYNVMVDVNTTSDRWVRASQYIPGDRTVLHHTLHSIIPPGATRGGSLLGGDDPDRPDIAPYIPGQSPRVEPPNTGGLLKAGTKIAMQMHYTTTGKETVDASRIGLWFYPEGFVPEERMSGACACHFTPTWVNIPPYDPDYEMRQSITIDEESKLFSLTSHMHFRGKRMRFYAQYPDGSEEELINIANYNYNWQLAYTFKEPKLIPAGTIITAIGAFDNSTQNVSNPDPARSVPWGLQSWDEMFFGAANWKTLEQGGH